MLIRNRTTSTSGQEAGGCCISFLMSVTFLQNPSSQSSPSMTQLSRRQNDGSWNASPQLTCMESNAVPEWFHWRITRKSAEELLMSKPPGYFLIRVSESRAGYTLSHRADGRCRHFMIDAKEDGSCSIVGEGKWYPSLQQLVDYHRKIPIKPYKDLLSASCGQTSEGWAQHHENNLERTLKTSEVLIPPRDKWNFDMPPNTPIPKTRKRYSIDVNPLPHSRRDFPLNTEMGPALSCQDDSSRTSPNTSPEMKTESEMTWEQLFDAVLRPYLEESERLPHEYSPPPPFAPGYHTGGP